MFINITAFFVNTTSHITAFASTYPALIALAVIAMACAAALGLYLSRKES